MALVLGHGAAGGVGSRDLVAVTNAALSQEISVALVEQPYRVAGRRSPALLISSTPPGSLWSNTCARGDLRGLPVVAGGRSSVARVACRTAEATAAVGVLCLAFPLQPPGRSAGAPRPSRLSELDDVAAPTLVVQGSRDRFGIPPPSARRQVVEVPGDHRLTTDLEAGTAAVLAWLPSLVPRAARSHSPTPAR